MMVEDEDQKARCTMGTDDDERRTTTNDNTTQQRHKKKPPSPDLPFKTGVV